MQYINSEGFDQVGKPKHFIRDPPFLAIDEHEQWYSKRRDADGKKGRWKGRVVTLAKLLQPLLSCQTFYCCFFFKRSLQTFSGEVVEQTESEAPWISFVFLNFIKERFDSPQRPDVYLCHFDQTVFGTRPTLCPQAAGGKAAGGRSYLFTSL
jgi:hypothetical protein